MNFLLCFDEHTWNSRTVVFFQHGNEGTIKLSDAAVGLGLTICTVLSDIQIRICLSCQEEPAIHYISLKRLRHHEESIPTVVRRIHCYGLIRKTRT